MVFAGNTVCSISEHVRGVLMADMGGFKDMGQEVLKASFSEIIIDNMTVASLSTATSSPQTIWK